MTDAMSAARDLLTSIPLRVRRSVYGLLGLAVVVDATAGTIAPDLIPDRVGDGLVIVFGLAGSLLALANSSPSTTTEAPS